MVARLRAGRMKTEVVRRKPKGEIGQACAGCEKYFRGTYWGRHAPEVVIEKVFTNRGKWRATRIYHGECFDQS